MNPLTVTLKEKIITQDGKDFKPRYPIISLTLNPIEPHPILIIKCYDFEKFLYVKNSIIAELQTCGTEDSAPLNFGFTSNKDELTITFNTNLIDALRTLFNLGCINQEVEKSLKDQYRQFCKEQLIKHVEKEIENYVESVQSPSVPKQALVEEATREIAEVIKTIPTAKVK